jgi:hypothetical protein
MFDEPSNGGFDDGYAGGGIVAFAAGGDKSKELSDEEIIQAILASKARENEPDFVRFGERVRGPQVDPDVAFGKELNAQLVNPPNMSVSLASMPPVNIAKPVSGGLDRLAKTPTKESDPSSDLSSYVSMLNKLYPKPEGYDEAYKALSAQYKDMPAQLEKQREQDKWMALTQLGASLASSKSPYFLQALGEAGTAALPLISASEKERRKAQLEALRGSMELSRARRAEDLALVSPAVSLHEAAQRAAERKYEADQRSKDRAAMLAERSEEAQQRAEDRELQRELAKERNDLLFKRIELSAGKPMSEAVRKEQKDLDKLNATFQGHFDNYNINAERLKTVEGGADREAISQDMNKNFSKVFSSYNALAAKLGQPQLKPEEFLALFNAGKIKVPTNIQIPEATLGRLYRTYGTPSASSAYTKGEGEDEDEDEE